ncbi:MAG: hypothetical protein WKF92_05160 [Pyrinomonadaceae bacterium]
MPEIIEVFEKDEHYFAVVEIEIDDVFKKFQFGVSRPGYLALKRCVQIRPFDMLPGLKYRYFYANSCLPYGTGKHLMKVRIELNRDATTKQLEIPKDLHANFLWFDRLRSFDEASHLEQKI